MLSAYQKIHIMGGAGSGKTTLAKWLADTSQMPAYHLDQIAWNRDGKVPLDQRMLAIEKILEQPTWVTEGAFLWWTDPLLENADVIVYLDLPFPLNAWRMVKRHVQASLSGDNPHGGLRNLIKFIYSVGKKYYRKTPIEPKGLDDDFAITRIGMLQVLSEHSDKVIHCKTRQDVAEFQDRALAQTR